MIRQALNDMNFTPDPRRIYSISGVDVLALANAIALALPDESRPKVRFVEDKNPGVSDHKKHRLGLPHPWTEACEEFGCVNVVPHPLPVQQAPAITTDTPAPGWSRLARDAEWGKGLTWNPGVDLAYQNGYLIGDIMYGNWSGYDRWAGVDTLDAGQKAPAPSTPPSPAPTPPGTPYFERDGWFHLAPLDYCIRKDGNQWAATYGSFKNLQESITGFGNTPIEAFDALEAHGTVPTPPIPAVADMVEVTTFEYRTGVSRRPWERRIVGGDGWVYDPDKNQGIGKCDEKTCSVYRNPEDIRNVRPPAKADEAAKLRGKGDPENNLSDELRIRAENEAARLRTELAEEKGFSKEVREANARLHNELADAKQTFAEMRRLRPRLMAADVGFIGSVIIIRKALAPYAPKAPRKEVDNA